MIKTVEKSDKAFLAFCNRDVFGTRIKAYYISYSTDYDFVNFWNQMDEDGNVQSVIGKVDGDVTLCVSDGADYGEIKQFLDFIGFVSLQCEKTAASKLGYESDVSGYVVSFCGNGYVAKQVEINKNFELKEIYDIIKSANLIGVGDYLPWLSDTTFRLNRGVTTAVLAQNNGKNAGCAMKIFETESAVLLGAVATVPEFRGKGIAGALVTMLAQESLDAGKRAELLCKKDSIVEFYKSIGFKVVNEWSIIFR